MSSIHNWIRKRRVCCTDSTAGSTAQFSGLNCNHDNSAISSTEITEIVITNEILLLLQKEGIGWALDASTHKMICTLNPPFCAIRSISYNNVNDTIMLVIHSRIFNNGLSISIHDLESIKEGHINPIEGAQELQKILIPYPGFVEFEDQSGVIVVSRSTPDIKRFHFFNMKDYRLIFDVDNTEFKEIRMSKGCVALFRQPKANILSVRLCNLINGEIMAERNLVLHEYRELRFLELCGCYLLAKQDNANIVIHDLIDCVFEKVSGTKKFLPKAVTFFTEGCAKEGVKPTKGPTSFLAAFDDHFEVCLCIECRLLTLFRISAQIQSPGDFLQVVQSNRLLLVYSQNSDSYYDVDENDDNKLTTSLVSSTFAKLEKVLRRPIQHAQEEGSLNSEEILSKEAVSLSRWKRQLVTATGSLVVSPELAGDCVAVSSVLAPSNATLIGELRKGVKKGNGDAGITILDLRSGRRLGFVKLTCDEKINVIAYDAKRNEILAGGSKGLHHIRSSFRQLNDFDESTCSSIDINDFCAIFDLALQIYMKRHGDRKFNRNDDYDRPVSPNVNSIHQRIFKVVSLESQSQQSHNKSTLHHQQRLIYGKRRYPTRQRKTIKRSIAPGSKIKHNK